MDNNIPDKKILEILSQEEFPFDACITCDFRNARKCAGPNASGMAPARRCDFLQKLQQYNRETRRNNASWSYDYIASQTNGVSKSTVVRCISDPNYVPGVDVYSEILRVLFDGAVNQYPCGIHSQEKEIMYVDSPETLKEMERLQQENTTLVATLEQLRANIGKTHEFQEKVIATIKEDSSRIQEILQAENEQLRAQINRKDDYIDRLAIKAGI